MAPEDAGADLEGLAGIFEVLASPPRLELLRVLRMPRALNDIRLPAARNREGERPERPLTRQAVTRHLEVLQDAHLVRRVPGEGARADRYALNHERIFAMVTEMRNLTKLRPLGSDGGRGGRATLDHDPGDEPELPSGPRLAVAYGRDDGVAFSLAGPPGLRWRIGRSPSCEIRLDYDAFLSGVHATIDRDAHGFLLRDEGSRNGTWVNWRRVPSGGVRILAPGEIVVVGRTVLVFQP